MKIFDYFYEKFKLLGKEKERNLSKEKQTNPASDTDSSKSRLLDKLKNKKNIQESQDDILALQESVKQDSLEKENRNLIGWLKTSGVVNLVLGCVAVALIIFFFVAWGWLSAYTKDLQASYQEDLEKTRINLIDGLYSFNVAINNDIPTRSERLEQHSKQAKAFVLRNYPKTTLTDKELNDLLILNFELAELYMISPWESLSYAMVESSFDKTVTSESGAKGLFQFLPSSMKLAMGDKYYPGCEFNPLLSCEAWYLTMIPVFESVNGDRKWAAANYYAGPIATKFYNWGYTLDQFMGTFKDPKVNKRYPWVVEKAFEDLRDYHYSDLSK